jgi:hypothetical protein
MSTSQHVDGRFMPPYVGRICKLHICATRICFRSSNLEIIHQKACRIYGEQDSRSNVNLSAKDQGLYRGVNPETSLNYLLAYGSLHLPAIYFSLSHLRSLNTNNNAIPSHWFVILWLNTNNTAIPCHWFVMLWLVGCLWWYQDIEADAVTTHNHE